MAFRPSMRMNSWNRSASHGGSKSVAAQTGFVHRVEIALPTQRPVAAQFVQIAPRIKAGVVAVVEHDADGVVADRHELALFGRMALHLGGRAFDAQQFRRQAEMGAVVERDVEKFLRALEADFRRSHGVDLVLSRACSASSSRRASSTSMIGMPSRIG